LYKKHFARALSFSALFEFFRALFEFPRVLRAFPALSV
jgi:hypothetical protein